MPNSKEKIFTSILAILFLSIFLIKPHAILHTHSVYHSGILLLPNKQIINYISVVIMMLISFYLGIHTQLYLENYSTTSKQLKINIAKEKIATDNKTGSSSGRTLYNLNNQFEQKEKAKKFF